MAIKSTLLTAAEVFKKAKGMVNTSVEEAIALAKMAQELAVKNKDHALECDTLLFLAKIYRIQGESYGGLEQLNKAYRLCNIHFPQNSIILSGIFKEYGSLYSDNFNDNTTALDYSLRSLSLKNPKLFGPLHNNIGCHYIKLEQYDKAKSFLDKGTQFCLEENNSSLLCFFYENFGEMYRLQSRPVEAIASFEKALATTEEAFKNERNTQETNYIYCFILVGMAKTYLDSGELSQIPELLKKIYEKTEVFDLKGCWSEAALIEGEVLLRTKKIKEFKDIFHKAIKFCTDNTLHKDKTVWLEKITDLCEAQGEYKEALSYSKQLMANNADKDSKTKAINLSKILENKEMEILALENRNREMQMQKSQLEEFAYIVAHDLKTPLSNISNFIGLFSSKYRDKVDEKNQFYLDFVLENSKKLHQMFDALLVYISISERKGSNNACNVQSLISNIRDKYRKELGLKNGVIEFGDLPMVRINSKHLQIIFDQLIQNALKFSRAERDCLIRIEVSENNKEYCFEVMDNGIGINPEHGQKIFELFKQLDKVNYTGTGMGLAICKKVINIYGGNIDFTINDWGGTSFQFNLPKKKRITA